MSPDKTFKAKDTNSFVSRLVELRSLGISYKRGNDLNDEELQDLIDNLKQTFYQEYKAAYSEA